MQRTVRNSAKGPRNLRKSAPTPLVIATQNPHKVAELRELLEGLPWTIKTLRDYPPMPEPPEEGETFEANARKKALYYCRHFGHPCVADDSGLMVDALGGEPGVRSARYAGPGCDYADNNRKLLRALEGIEEAKRKARFVCCAALALPGGRVHVETGVVEGRIAFECRGTYGFGYDPLFIPDGYTETFGELGPAVKQSISHRSRAFKKIREYLESIE